MPRIKLTERAIARLKGRPAEDRSREPQVHWDEAMPGFGVAVSTKTGLKSYVAQRTMANGKSPRKTIALVGEITLEEARAKARDVIHGMRHGIHPKASRGAPTLAAVAEAYIAAHNLAENSKLGYARALALHLSDWKEMRLGDITADMVEDRHKKLGKASKSAADGVMRALRAWFNYAIEKFPEVTTNPVRLRRQWYKVPRRERHVSADNLPAFYRAVLALENPVGRDYILMLLFTGLRRREAAGLTWADVDFTARVVRLPAVRTKAGRKLDLPMTDVVLELLQKRRELGDKEFVFPAYSKSGHVSEPKSWFGLIAEATGIVVSPHDLRRVFANAAVAAGVHTIYLKALLNHSAGKGDTTVDYTVQNTNDLRLPAQRIVDQLKIWCGISEK